MGCLPGATFGAWLRLRGEHREATEKGTADNVTPSPPQTSDSSFAWKVSLFEYSKLPLRKSLTALPPSTTSQPPVSTSYRTARTPTEGPIHSVAVSLPTQIQTPITTPKSQREAPKRATRQVRPPTHTHRPLGWGPGSRHRTKRGAFRVPAQLSRLWATLASRRLSSAGHKGCFQRKLLSQTLDPRKTTLGSKY